MTKYYLKYSLSIFILMFASAAIITLDAYNFNPMLTLFAGIVVFLTGKHLLPWIKYDSPRYQIKKILDDDLYESGLCKAFNLETDGFIQKAFNIKMINIIKQDWCKIRKNLKEYPDYILELPNINETWWWCRHDLDKQVYFLNYLLNHKYTTIHWIMVVLFPMFVAIYLGLTLGIYFAQHIILQY